MATSDYWSDSDLKALAFGGLVNEDVMQKIWNLSVIPLPFTDAVGYGAPIKATPFAWTKDSQAAIDVSTVLVDGADAGSNDAAGGDRVQNHAQINGKVVEVTERAQAVDTIGRANERAYQISMRQRDNRRNIEGVCVSQQASVADDGNTTGGRTGTLSAWLESNTDNGATGSDGGFNTGTGIVDAPTNGTARALSVATLGNMVESTYINNGNPTILMGRPGLIRRLNDYILQNPTSFGIATPTANVSGSDTPTDQVAQGYVSVLITSFGTTLKLVSNRLQQEYGTNRSDLFGIDTGMCELANLIGEKATPIAKLGLADRDQISQQWGFRCMDEAAHFVIRDLNDGTAVVA